MAQELTFNISEDRRKLQGPVEVKDFNLKFGTDGVAITHGNPKQWVQGRIGDDQLKQVFVNITEGEGNTPKDVAGMFLAFVGIIHDKDGRPHRVVDYKHSTTIDVEHGRFRFDFPDQAFTVAGEYQQAFFMLIKEGPGGGCVATMEFDMQVMANFVFTDLVPENYITPFNDTVDQLLAACKKFKEDTAADEAKFKQELEDAYAKFQKDTNTQFSNFKDATDDDLAKFKKANADDIANFKQQYADAVKAKQDELQKIVDNYTDKIDTMLKDLNQQGIDTSTMLTDLRSQMAALQDKIEREHFFTEDEAKEFEDSINDWLKTSTSRVFDSVSDLKNAELIEGQTVKTLGFYAKGDGGSANYTITKNPQNYAVPLKNDLYAEQINSGENNYYDELNVTTERINDTDTYFVDIPKVDSHGQNITPYIAQNAAYWDWNSTTSKNVLQPFNDKDRTPTEYARHAHTTLTVNGSSSVEINSNSYNEANVIGNGKVLRKWHNQTTMPDNFVYVCIMKDRSLKEYPNTATTDQMLADGVQDCWLSYWRLINNRQLVDNSKSVGNEGHTRANDNNPHLGFGIMSDGTLVIAACDGRTKINPGLTSDEFAQAMLDHGCVDAWHMDGGGSTSVTYKGSKLNRNIDDDGTRDRSIPFTFNIKKPNAGGGVVDAFSQAGKVKQEVIKQIMPEVNELKAHTVKWVGQFNFKSDDELDNWLTNDFPDLVSWYDYPAGCTLMGVIVTQYQGSAPAKVIGYPNSADWFFKYETSGSHKWGTLAMQFGGWPAVKRNYQAPLTPKWTDWYSTEAPQVVTPKFVDTNIIKEFHAVQVGNAVQVNMKWEYGTIGTWKTAVTGLPFPALAMSLNAHDVIGTNGSRGRYAIYDDGKIGFDNWEVPQGKTTDSFEVSFVYLTGHATDAIKDAAKQHIPMGKNTDN